MTMTIDAGPTSNGAANAAFSVEAAREQSRFNWMVEQGKVTPALVPKGTKVAILLVDFSGRVGNRTVEAGPSVSIRRYIPNGDHSECTMVTPLWKPTTPDFARDGRYIKPRQDKSDA